MRRIMVVGLLPKQFNNLVEPEGVRVINGGLPSERRGKRVSYPKVDMIVVSRFITHAHINKLKRHCSTNVVKCRIGEVQEILDRNSEE